MSSSYCVIDKLGKNSYIVRMFNTEEDYRKMLPSLDSYECEYIKMDESILKDLIEQHEMEDAHARP